MEQLQNRVKKGNVKAKATVANKKRVKEGKWVGNVQEIVSTCCGAWKNKNKNVKKFDEGGVTFRKYPLKPSKDDPVYLMLFPSKYASAIVTCLETVFGKDAKDEKVPDKFKT